MQISLIAAMTKNGVIGKNNALPWHLPEDLKHFRKTTAGKPVLMGRKTFESIGKPLPNRQNIILTRDPHFAAEGCTVVHSLETALNAAVPAEQLMVIGGANIYELCLPITSRMVLSIIHQEYEGDTYFPNIHWENWQVISEEDKGDFTIKILDKKRS